MYSPADVGTGKAKDEELLLSEIITALNERTTLIHGGLKALNERESARRLARLGGTEPRLQPIPRCRAQYARFGSTPPSGSITCALALAALERGSVLMRPFVLGELACGNLKRRGEVLRL